MLDTLKTALLEIQHIRDAVALLSWDQETGMPTGGGYARAAQLATLQTLAHDKLVSADMETLLLPHIDPATGCVTDTAGLDDTSRALLRETWRDFSKAKKLPSDFVARLEHACSLARQAWIEARHNNDFARFLPHLRTIVTLKFEEMEYMGYAESPYDALLDDYEPGATVSQLHPLFATLRHGLTALLEDVRASASPPNDRLLYQSCDHAQQIKFGTQVLRAMGYDFQRGRLDLSAHPFTTAMHPTDVRVTTRVFEQDFPSCLFSCIHEGGHGLYEQGLPQEQYGTPLGQPLSLGMHESQSRLWENHIGRSKAFWIHFFPLLQQHFPAQFGAVSLDDLYAALNTVRPSLIRVEADEVTYNLHIMVRFDLERALMEKRMAVEDLPTLWREHMRDYLGIIPEQDTDGVLQDIHWSLGSFGYFPTYTLGNLYASMFDRQVRQDIPTLDTDIQQGRLQSLRAWLNQHIHQHGRRYSSAELLHRITGQTLGVDPFLTYLRAKIGNVYGFTASP